MNVDSLEQGIVIDHIQAGKSMDIYFKLGLDRKFIKLCSLGN